jgi:predicted nucleic-acid-binding protein
MIAADTNVLLRLLIHDDPRQKEIVDRLLQSAREQGEVCLVSNPVLCEIEWVLARSYSAKRKDCAVAFQGFLEDPFFVFEDRSAVGRALLFFQEGKASFADYLIGETAQTWEARTTFTFDRDLAGQPGFTVLG